MKRVLFVLTVAMLALPATALAKGPSEAKITGPGLAKAITISGEETEGSPIMELADAAGFFPASFGQTPNPMTASAPKGSLGPKYSIVYTVPGPDGGNQTIRQDAYPYATPYSVTYMKSGQAIFDMKTYGGWFTDTRLKEVLVAHGLPKTAAAAKSNSSSSAGFFSTGKLGALVLVLLVLGGAFVLMRRRSGESTA
jgi:hypothetical protein